MIFGDISTGAQNDLQSASDIARSMVMNYGMSERLELLTYTRQQSAYMDMGLGRKWQSLQYFNVYDLASYDTCSPFAAFLCV